MHSAIGWNARMDGIQAAVLSVKLAHLNAGNEARRAHARRYNDLLADDPGSFVPKKQPIGSTCFTSMRFESATVMACCSGWRLAG